MISYQWDVQKSMIQLRNQLQSHGYKVWMDIDEMGGSTLESMARAVENASVVLVGVSQKYKESPNCRSGDYKETFITRWREDMNFMFSWQEQYLTRSLRSLVRYCSCHSNIKFISSSQRVMFFLLYGD